MARPKLYDDDLRLRLIGAAADAIAAGGVENLSLRRVAQCCGTSTNAVYALLGSKDDLVLAVIGEAGRSFVTDQLAVPQSSDALADLVQLGRAYRHWALAHPALYAVMFGGRAPAPEELKAGEPPEAMQPLLRFAARAAEHSDGRALGTDPHRVAMSIWAIVHGSTSLELTACAYQPVQAMDALFEEQLQMVIGHWFG